MPTPLRHSHAPVHPAPAAHAPALPHAVVLDIGGNPQAEAAAAPVDLADARPVDRQPDRPCPYPTANQVICGWSASLFTGTLGALFGALVAGTAGAAVGGTVLGVGGCVIAARYADRCGC